MWTTIKCLFGYHVFEPGINARFDQCRFCHAKIRVV